jgi:hypothetical protein
LQPFLPTSRYTQRGRNQTEVEFPVFSCDYNGWADVPEEEREGIDAFEATGSPNANDTLKPEVATRFLPVRLKEAGVPHPVIERRRRAA